MDNKEIAQEWFRIGDLDYKSAAFLKQMKPLPIEIVCYHCQQCAEKYLKGFIALKGGEIPRVHDLVALNKLCRKYKDEFKEIENSCIDLTDYGVQVRYPFMLEVEERDVMKALEDANKIRTFVRKQI